MPAKSRIITLLQAVLRLERASESPEGLVKPRIAASHIGF